MVKDPKILVIGAGSSGIAAATKLYENGLTNITILEAEDKIGGRINSVEFGGSVIDLGGTWVHGENGNLVYEMVKDLDMLSPSVKMFEDMTFYLPDGTMLNKNVTDKLCKIAQELLSDEDAKKENDTLGNYFIEKYKEAVLLEFGSNQEFLKVANQIQDWFSNFSHLKCQKSWHDISVRGNFAQKSCEGNQLLNWRNKGFKTILDLLLNKFRLSQEQIPLDDKILLNKEVNSIVWNESSNQSEVIVHCSDGSSYTAHHVIITISLGVLKKNHRNWFKPELPPYKVNSIEHRVLGIVNKIFLKFTEKWWPNDLVSFDIIWTDEARFNLKKEVKNLEPTVNGRSWLEDIFGFYRVDSHPNVLLVWVTGELAGEVEKVSDEIIMANCMYLLRKFVGNKYTIVEPDGILRSKWSTNPHFFGSYTFSSIEEEENKASAEDLAHPVASKNGNDLLLFAGESTHATHFATVHGAIETGYREAERLIQFYKRKTLLK